MGFSDWIRVVDTIGTLAGRLKGGVPATQQSPPAGALETRLAGVVVAALKEAFDRDRARMDLERSQVESERRRAEEALAAELKRQAAERALGQLKLLALMAIAMWMLSAVLAVWLPGMRAGLPRTLLAAGWTLAFGALGCTFAGSQQTSAWTAGATNPIEMPRSAAASAAPWLLLGALGSTAASLLLAL
jgi:hypothetical protein